LKENKLIEVIPNKVNTTIELWQNFGWELVGTPQEIYNKTKDSHLERRGVYNVRLTEATHYFKITFQREKNMPHYDELVKLESAYYKIQKPTLPPRVPSIQFSLTILFLFYIYSGAICFGLLLNSMAFWMGDISYIPSIIFISLGILIFYIRRKLDKKRKQQYKNDCSIYEREAKDYYNAVENYVQSLRSLKNRAKLLLK
jgi:hypothetical protein